MKLFRYLDQNGENGASYGTFNVAGQAVKLRGSIFGDFEVTSQLIPEDFRILAPLKPVAIVAIALNYKAHAEEFQGVLPSHPSVFMKLPWAVQNPGDPVSIPRFLPSGKVDYEGELVIVIGKECKNVTPERAMEYVLGFTCGNDITARDWQKEWGGGQYCRGKTFDTFCPLGPWIVTRDEISDPGALRIRTRVNGELRQDGTTRNLIFDIPTLVSFLSGSTTLRPGTIILTGTPAGVGMGMNPPQFLKAGDKIEVEIEGIGSLQNPVVNEPL